MAGNQAYIFIIFTLNGVFIGLLFDIFRILRKSIKTKDLVTYIEDVIFWILTGISIIYSMCVYCNGEIRFFMVLGIIIGIALYMLTISNYVIKIFVSIILFLKKILEKLIKIVIFPVKIIVKKVILNPISIICINLSKLKMSFLSKKRKNMEKNLKNVS